MSGELLTFSLAVFMGFFAIMNPIANTPVFLGLVGDMDAAQKKRLQRLPA
jgi:multiple antibiotic resistance protein